MMLDSGTSPEPETVGRYRVLRTLDDSGDHAVHLAEAPNSRRRVALRVSLADGAREREAALDRFLREREITGSLDHPGVVRVIEVDEDPVLGPFLVMEFVDGLSLRESLRRGALTPEVAIAVVVDVGSILDAAHASGRVHGDLRPSRILVNPAGSACITGFGAAAEGTPVRVGVGWPYLAPERIAGAPPSAEADRWALVMIALELLTGQPTTDGGTLPPGLDPALRGVFERALARDPGLRHPTLRAFLEALVSSSDLPGTERSALLANLPARRRVVSSTEEESRRQRRVVALAAFGIVAALGVRAGGDWVFRDVPRPPAPRLLEVSSAPQGATVLVDGIPVGETPRRLFVPADAGRVRIEKDGYRAQDRILDGSDRDLAFSLDPAAPVRIAFVPRRPPRRAPVKSSTAALAPAVPAAEEPEAEATGLLPLLADWLSDRRR